MPTQGQPKPQITRRPNRNTKVRARKKVRVPGVCKEGNTGWLHRNPTKGS
jgi:hypothetical protein